MQKITIATVVGGIILFLWQFLSWGLINLHRDTQQYTPKESEVLQYLDENLDEGFYFMPGVPPGTSQADEQKLMEESLGKPWAEVRFHKSMTMNMGSNMARGIVVDFLSVFLLIWILMKMQNPNMATILLSSVAVGIIGYLTTTYTRSIWFEVPTITDLIDGIASWGLVGIWLGWFLRR